MRSIFDGYTSHFVTTVVEISTWKTLQKVMISILKKSSWVTEGGVQCSICERISRGRHVELSTQLKLFIFGNPRVWRAVVNPLYTPNTASIDSQNKRVFQAQIHWFQFTTTRGRVHGFLSETVHPPFWCAPKDFQHHVDTVSYTQLTLPTN